MFVWRVLSIGILLLGSISVIADVPPNINERSLEEFIFTVKLSDEINSKSKPGTTFKAIVEEPIGLSGSTVIGTIEDINKNFLEEKFEAKLSFNLLKTPNGEAELCPNTYNFLNSKKLSNLVIISGNESPKNKETEENTLQSTGRVTNKDSEQKIEKDKDKDRKKSKYESPLPKLKRKQHEKQNKLIVSTTRPRRVQEKCENRELMIFSYKKKFNLEVGTEISFRTSLIEK